MFSNLFSSINDNIFECLDDLIFVNEKMMKNIIPVLGTGPRSGIIFICNSLVYGFLIYYAISYLLSHITFSQVERPSQFIFKIILCAIALNSSEFICSFLISLFSNISNAICSLGDFLFDFDVSFAAFIRDVIPEKYFVVTTFNLFSFERITCFFYVFWLF